LAKTRLGHRLTQDLKSRLSVWKSISIRLQSTIFRVDLEQSNAEPTVFRDTVVDGLNKDEFETRQVFVPSKDGTKVPMFIGEGRFLHGRCFPETFEVIKVA
jgi:prolyl oligopeptidase PreP (S9A serine peptidase family)